MDKLTKHLVDGLIPENLQIKTVVAIYPGRFQPMGAHHSKTYKWLKSKFKNAYVATSGKVDLPKSPFSFAEKKKIIKSHGISKIVQVKNPYKAEEILKKYDPKTTAAVFMVGSKDAGRLKGKFFQDWKGKAEVGYKDGAYLILAPHVSMNVSGYGEMSGTAIRKALGDLELKKKEKQKIFKQVFGHMKNYNMVVSKLEQLNESILEFCTNVNFLDLISEANSTATTGGDVDDGPPTYFINNSGYEKNGKKFAEMVGYEVLNYIIGDGSSILNLASDKNVLDYTQGVTYFPAGVAGADTITNPQNYKETKAYKNWKSRITKIAQIAGMKFISFMGAEESKDTTNVSGDKIREPMKYEKKPTNVSETLSKWLVDEILLTEGGAYGHMSHPFDDKGLTFGDFKKIIDLSLQGNLDLEKAATEKTDGQNLFISWNGKMLAARNTGDLKRGGMDYKAVAAKFKGRGNIEKAFTFAMKDLGKAIGSLNPKQQKKIFDDGNNWVNMEIMFPASANVITYDAPYLQFHNVLQYKDGKAIGSVSDGARILAGMIAQTNQTVQKNFSIIGPKVLKMNPHQDYSAKKPYFTSKLNKLMKKFNMKDSSTFAEYHQAWWEDYVDKNIKEIDNKTKMGLVKRWAFFDKSFRLDKKTLPNEETLKKAKEFDKQKHADQVKKNMQPFETLFFELGAEVLKNVEGFLAANPDKAIQNVRKQVAKAIGDVRKGGDLKKLNRMTQQLKKIASIGGFKTIIPSEGLVFIYKGNTYKLTGAFAPVNQITGMMTF
tara:strand:+ start:1764 stop:4082 length:2319 start_codon:yes stop_codon:yes gene_type:complete